MILAMSDAQLVRGPPGVPTFMGCLDRWLPTETERAAKYFESGPGQEEGEKKQ